MNAQQLIDEVEVKKTDFLTMFYPTLAAQSQANFNLTNCARSQK